MHEFLHQNNNFRVQNAAPKTAPSVRKVYEQNTSDNSDYGELRAIVKRIENESQSDFQVKQEAEKKLVFDYVPASGMMKR